MFGLLSGSASSAQKQLHDVLEVQDLLNRFSGVGLWDAQIFNNDPMHPQQVALVGAVSRTLWLCAGRYSWVSQRGTVVVGSSAPRRQRQDVRRIHGLPE